MKTRTLLSTKVLWATGALMALVALLSSACAGGVSQSDYNALQAQLQARDAELAKLQKSVPTPAPPFGIASESFDAGGSPAYEATPGQLLAFVQSGMAYDSPANANYVSVVDAVSRKVLTQVAVDMPKGYQSHGLGVSANAQWVYLPSLSAGSKKLFILDGHTLKLARTLDVGANTHHVDEGTYKQTGSFVMVDTGNPDHGEIVLDPNKNNEVVGQIPFGTVLGRPYSGWSSPDGTFAYVTVNSHLGDQKGWISRVDLSTYKETAFFPVGVGPVWVAFSRDGKTAWVSDAGSKDVMEIAVAQNKDEKDKVVATVPLDGSPYGIVLTHDGTKLYVVKKTYGADDASTSVYVVDTAAKKVTKEIKVGKQPDHVFLTPDGREVWVGENRSYQVSIIDTATDSVTGRIPMPGDVHSVRFVEMSSAPVATAAGATNPSPKPTAPATQPAAQAGMATPSVAALRDLAARGEKLYSQSPPGCQNCHGKDARGGSAPSIRGKSADEIRYALQNVTLMQPLKLTSDEIDALAAYLASMAQE